MPEAREKFSEDIGADGFAPDAESATKLAEGFWGYKIRYWNLKAFFIAESATNLSKRAFTVEYWYKKYII